MKISIKSEAMIYNALFDRNSKVSAVWLRSMEYRLIIATFCTLVII